MSINEGARPGLLLSGREKIDLTRITDAEYKFAKHTYLYLFRNLWFGLGETDIDQIDESSQLRIEKDGYLIEASITSEEDFRPSNSFKFSVTLARPIDKTRGLRETINVYIPSETQVSLDIVYQRVLKDRKREDKEIGYITSTDKSGSVFFPVIGLDEIKYDEMTNSDTVINPESILSIAKQIGEILDINPNVWSSHKIF